MNRWKGNAVTQITLDEDFIVPDTLEDMEQVILEQAHIQGENVKTQEEKITVKGKLEFQVLYRKENGGLETLGGNIPFEETVNVPGLAEGDHRLSRRQRCPAGSFAGRSYLRCSCAGHPAQLCVFFRAESRTVEAA